jgi:predicted O-methyltransferase YrrM
VIPPKLLGKVLPESLKVRLRPALQRFYRWQIDFRADCIAYLARPLKKQDPLGMELFARLESQGLHVLPVNYYSPVPDTIDLRNGHQGWRDEADLSDICFNLDEQRQLGENFVAYREELSQLPDAEDLRQCGYGLGYSPVDAMLLHCFVRHFRPSRIIEVGSGVSTVYEAHAISLNADKGAHPCTLTCIEPYPSHRLRSIAQVTEIIAKKVQELSPSAFDVLDAGDILFIDSSHSVKVGSDVNFLLLQVLPALQPGVLIHIHDIVFPYLAPPDFWLFERLMFWQENVLLKAMLSGNPGFEVIYCASYLHHKDPGALRAAFPQYDPEVHYPQSIWLRKRGTPRTTNERATIAS